MRDKAQAVVKWYGTNVDIEDRRASERLARGQLNALTSTLDLLSQETDPDQLPKHIVTTIATQMGAHSVTIWERKEDDLELLGILEEGEFRTRRETGYFGGTIPVVGKAPPLWVEAMATGDYMLIEDVYKDDSHFNLADGRSVVWKREDLTPVFVALKNHMMSQGVRGLLISPMMLAGRLEGIVGIRFTGDRKFKCEDIDLMRALAHQAMLALQLMRLSRKSRQAAVNAERNRMAQEIHDTLAQGLTGIIVQLEAAEDARAMALESEAEQHLERAARLARESLREARASVHALRPPALTEQHLCSVLATMIDETTKGTSLAGEFVVEGHPMRLPDAWEQNLLRMVQEALANALRHAHASRFKAKMIFSVHEVRLEMSDNGRGFDPQTIRQGLGLRGLRERTEAMGGNLNVQSDTDNGTFISATFPTIRTSV